MGRTLPTQVQSQHLELEEWKNFRRALRKEDQEAFDALWRAARYHAAPVAMADPPVPIIGIMMAMLVSLSRKVMELDREAPDRRLDI